MADELDVVADSELAGASFELEVAAGPRADADERRIEAGP